MVCYLARVAYIGQVSTRCRLMRQLAGGLLLEQGTDTLIAFKPLFFIHNLAEYMLHLRKKSLKLADSHLGLELLIFCPLADQHLSCLNRASQRVLQIYACIVTRFVAPELIQNDLWPFLLG